MGFKTSRGPWKALHYWDEGWTVVSDGGNYVALCSGVSAVIDDDDEIADNARLMAAAPTMRTALLQILLGIAQASDRMPASARDDLRHLADIAAKALHDATGVVCADPAKMLDDRDKD